jgi:hypothetical protein
MGETASELTGGCACGAVRYRLEREPILVNNCHCRLCQRQTGSTSVVNAFYESDAITRLSGDTVEPGVEAGSGGTHSIVRCAECGTALWSHYPRLGPLAAGVRVGTLDDPGALRPDAAIFVASKMPWVTLPEGIPHFEASYDPAEVLPPERMARLRALIERRAAQAKAAR